MAKILIVDDTLEARDLQKAILSIAGYEVIESENGAQAIQLYEAHNPGLVIIDIYMPIKNGIETIKVIHAKNPDVKILVVTAIGEERMARLAVREGAFGYLVKPYLKADLLKAVEEHLPKGR